MTPFAKLAATVIAANEVRGMIVVALSSPAWAPFVSPWAVAITFAAVGGALGLWAVWRTLTANVSQALEEVHL